jgi:hypothetical protein
MTVATRKRTTLVVTGVAFGVAVIALIAFLIMVLFKASGQIRDLDASSRTQAAQIQGLAGAVDTARAQIKSLGATPVVPAPSQILETVSVTGPAGPQGSPGQGASDAQVSQAVSLYLAAHPVPGVSDQQIAAAVDAYFAATPPPSGSQGPGPSDQQIADAVASYMAENPAPSGGAGTQGEGRSQGQKGSPPAGWTLTDPSGVTYTCAPDDQTPAPHYTCTPVTASASPSASPSASASGGAAAAADVISTQPATVPTKPTPTPTATRTALAPPRKPTPTPTPVPTRTPSPVTRILAALGLPVLRRDDYYLINGD